MLFISLVTVGCAGTLAPYRSAYLPQEAVPRAIREALAASNLDQKPVLLEFGAEWCGLCRQREAVLRTRRVEAFLQEHFHVVWTDIPSWDWNLEINRRFSFVISRAIPAEVVMRPSGELPQIVGGHDLPRPTP